MGTSRDLYEHRTDFSTDVDYPRSHRERPIDAHFETDCNRLDYSKWFDSTRNRSDAFWWGMSIGEISRNHLLDRPQPNNNCWTRDMNELKTTRDNVVERQFFEITTWSHTTAIITFTRAVQLD